MGSILAFSENFGADAYHITATFEGDGIVFAHSPRADVEVGGVCEEFVFRPIEKLVRDGEFLANDLLFIRETRHAHDAA